MDVAFRVWEITKSSLHWGRVRIANQIALLNVFISASTVRNILQETVGATFSYKCDGGHVYGTG